MISYKVQGLIWGAISVVFLIILFTFLRRPLRHWKTLKPGSKSITAILTIIDMTLILTGAVFCYRNLTYQPPRPTKITKSLQKTMKQERAMDANKYTQKITMKQYENDTEQQLYNMYTAKGKADIDSYASDSPKTKSLILRNVGRVIKPGGDSTTKLETISGAKINLCDGKNRLLIFCDGSKYSLQELKILNDYNQNADDSSESKINYVIIFPTLSGTDINNLFENDSDDIGDKSNLNIVSTDSMPDNTQMNIKYITMNEYQIKDVPSVIAIDKNGVICNAGVGSTFTTQAQLKTFLQHSFNASSSLYREIK